MVLGTYWYFGFPDGIYNFELLDYRYGIGGRSDVDAELSINFESGFADAIVAEINDLFERFPDAAIFMWRNANQIQLGVGGRELFDYDFMIGLEVEKILRKYSVVRKNRLDWTESYFTRWYAEKRGAEAIPEFVQIVGSEKKFADAENLSMRVDCHIPTSEKKKFVDDLADLANFENLSVFYYLEFETVSNTNLMLFFSNGRQGLDLKPMQSVNIKSFENKFLRLLEKHRAMLKHFGGLDFYPKGKPVEILMVDHKFILSD
ncbi:hypothetical protein [Flavobacterium sp.]|uniref:hypothetical protein n=1 Tax=Flavobacterium sp. TaxID=239 RepID=UPI00121AB3B4|nr:hypothetical protein [Flavobacterium sp.]RZJ73510.1 MAG: hypothetical protein EOO49_01470 [Flavobacterium sp.]